MNIRKHFLFATDLVQLRAAVAFDVLHTRLQLDQSTKGDRPALVIGSVAGTSIFNASLLLQASSYKKRDAPYLLHTV